LRARQREIRAHLGERFGQLQPESARAAGDERDAPFRLISFLTLIAVLLRIERAILRLRQHDDLAGDLAIEHRAQRLRRIGQRIAAEISGSAFPGQPCRTVRDAGRSRPRLAAAEPPQNTPTMLQPLSSGRLSGIAESRRWRNRSPDSGRASDRAQRRLRIAAADRVVDDVGALAAGQLADRDPSGLRRVVDRRVGAVLRRPRALPRSTRRRSRARPALADLDGSEPDAARRAEHHAASRRLQAARSVSA
jgi:hypothetical protein